MPKPDSIDFEKMSDAHRVILSGMKQQQGAKPKPLLADRLQSPTAWHKSDGHRFMTNMQQLIRSHEVIVLDDAATRLVAETAHTTPKVMAAMTELAVSPYDRLWVEMSYTTLSEVIVAQSGVTPRRDVAPGERIGFAFENRDGAVVLRIVQHVDGDDRHVHEWPASFIISNTGQPLRTADIEQVFGDTPVVAEDGVETGGFELMRLRASNPGKAAQQTGRLWGCAPDTKDLKKLHGLAELLVTPEAANVWNGYDLYALAQNAARELTGTLRRAVAVLALMNTTIIQTAERTRPQGRFMIGGGQPKPFLTRTTAVVNIPHRVRKVYDYVHKEIRDEVSRIRHRRHRVAGHFRHLPYEPINGHGWAPCFCPGREPGRYWHRYVREHERGDESLGRVEHDYHIARGDDE